MCKQAIYTETMYQWIEVMLQSIQVSIVSWAKSWFTLEGGNEVMRMAKIKNPNIRLYAEFKWWYNLKLTSLPHTNTKTILTKVIFRISIQFEAAHWLSHNVNWAQTTKYQLCAKRQP